MRVNAVAVFQLHTLHVIINVQEMILERLMVPAIKAMQVNYEKTRTAFTRPTPVVAFGSIIMIGVYYYHDWCLLS